MSERDLRNQICEYGASMFDRGLTGGSSGNISVRIGDEILITPTNSSLGRLDPDRISKVRLDGELLSGDKPSKETFLHLAMYGSRASDKAIVHLHSTWSVAVSCLADVDPENCLPPITAYYVMRVGRLPRVPYYPPGDRELANEIQHRSVSAKALLLANHGPIVSGKSLEDAVNATEELEETAKLFLMLRGMPTQYLTDDQCSELGKRFPN
jgi:3-dehydro-4-phosphotetronate decarboxylase